MSQTLQPELQPTEQITNYSQSYKPCLLAVLKESYILDQPMVSETVPVSIPYQALHPLASGTRSYKTNSFWYYPAALISPDQLSGMLQGHMCTALKSLL